MVKHLIHLVRHIMWMKEPHRITNASVRVSKDRNKTMKCMQPCGINLNFKTWR